MKFTNAGRAALLLTSLILTACGGGTSTTSNASVSCDPNNPATFDECGTVLIGFTDADTMSMWLNL